MLTQLIYVVLFLLVMAVVALLYTAYMQRRWGIPKVIWTYWHDDKDMPDVVKRCIDTWRKTNPDFTIEILNNKRVKELCGVDLEALNIKPAFHARYADFARLFVVLKFGGVWMDSSVICTRRLDGPDGIIKPLWSRGACDLIAYYAPHTREPAVHPIPENWFFAAPAASPFVRDWLQEALRMLSEFESEEAFVEDITKRGEYDIQGLGDALPYLNMHLCATIVEQRSPGAYKLHMTPAVDGPFKYLVGSDWKAPECFAKLCGDTEMQDAAPMIKLRGVERKYLMEHKVACDAENKHVRWVVSGKDI